MILRQLTAKRASDIADSMQPLPYWDCHNFEYNRHKRRILKVIKQEAQRGYYSVELTLSLPLIERDDERVEEFKRKIQKDLESMGYLVVFGESKYENKTYSDMIYWKCDIGIGWNKNE